MERNRHDVIRAASRSIWKERFNQNFNFFCPMCSVPRRLGMHPEPGRPRHFIQIGLTAVVFALGLWALFPWIGSKGLVAFVPLWIAFEIIYRTKVRGSVICGQCGFDPVLYLVDVGRARQAVRAHWKTKFEEKGIPFPEEKIGIHASRQQRDASITHDRASTYSKIEGISRVDSPGSEVPGSAD